MKRLLALLFLFSPAALAQRGGSLEAQQNLMPTCVATSGACPAQGYFCASGTSIWRCLLPNTWVGMSSGSGTGTDLNCTACVQTTEIEANAVTDPKVSDSITVDVTSGRGTVYNEDLDGAAAQRVACFDLTGKLTYGATTCDAAGGPGGATTQLQYNSAGGFAGNAAMTFNSTTLDFVSKRFNGGYWCGADWNGDATAGDFKDVLACLTAARTATTTAENGNDNAVDVYLPTGKIDFCDSSQAGGNPCPFTLKSGMRIHGVLPRAKDEPSDDAQDLIMTPNGGTWLDGNTTNSAAGIFNGSQLRGIMIEDVGFYNYEKALVFGAAAVDGIAWSTFRNLYFTGISTNNQTVTAVHLTNPQHVMGTSWNAVNCYKCYRITQDHSVSQYGNSTFVDIYSKNYNTNDSADAYGLWMECNYAGAGTGNLLNDTRFYGAQFNNYSAEGVAVFLDGESGNSCLVNGARFSGLTLDGNPDFYVKMRSTVQSTFDFDPNASNADVDLDMNTTDTENNFFTASPMQVQGDPAIGTNFFFGAWGGVPGTSQTLFDRHYYGLLRDTSAGVGSQVAADSARLGFSQGKTIADAAANMRSVSIDNIFLSADAAGDGPDGTSLYVSTVNNPSVSGAASDTLGIMNSMSLQGAQSTTLSDDSQIYVAQLDGIVSPAGKTRTEDDIRFYSAEFGGSFSGSGSTTVNRTDVFNIQPLASSYTGSTFAVVRGLHIGDMAGLGSTNKTVSIEAQTGASASKGNLVFEGGSWNNGHAVLGPQATGAHLWFDTAGVLRAKVGSVPTGETDGTDLLAAGGESTTASNLGGGLANFSTLVSSDLRFNSFAAADFDLASNLISIDDATWAKDATVLALAGGTLTGQLVTDNLGIEFEESDTNPTCAAGNYAVYADLSEAKFKKCTNGTVSDLDTTGGGGGAGTIVRWGYDFPDVNTTYWAAGWSIDGTDLTNFKCAVDTGTCSIKLAVNGTVDVNAADCVCGTSLTTCTITAGALATDDFIDVDIKATCTAGSIRVIAW